MYEKSSQSKNTLNQQTNSVVNMVDGMCDPRPLQRPEAYHAWAPRVTALNALSIAADFGS